MLIALLVTATAFISCFDNVNKSRLKWEIATANRDCPTETPGVGRLDSLSLEDNDEVVAYYYTIYEDNEQLSVDAVRENSDFVKRKMINTALANNRQSLQMFEKYHAGLRYVFRDEKTGKTAIIFIPIDEIEQALSQPLSQAQAAEMALKDDLIMSKKSLPINIDVGLKIVDFILDNNQLVYVVDVDEDRYPMSDEFDIEGAKQGIIEELNNPAPGMTTTLNNLVKTARSMVYRYVGSKTKKQVDVEISTIELRTILSKH